MVISRSTYASSPALSPFHLPSAPRIDLASKDVRDKDGWSSLIGIITAICGNILISIALNTQRYAHLKLSQQWTERRRLLKRAERRRTGAAGDGQARLSAKERQKLKRKLANGTTNESPTTRRAGSSFEEEDEDSGEREPLLSSYRSAEEDTDPDDADLDSESDSKPEISRQSYLKSPYWWAGIVMMTIGEAGNFLAYGFAPASIVSPLGVVAIISNCIIAPFFMKETFRWRDFFGVVIAVGGAVTVVFSASENNPKLGPDEIWELIATWEFETYLAITTSLIIALMLASNKYGHKSIFIDLGLVGLFGGYTALSTKGVASMLSYTLFHALTFPVTYLLVLVLVFTAVMQIKYVNRALQRFDATQVIPTQFVMFTLSVIIGSAILYRDFERTPGEDAGKFFGGCAMTFIGVWLITSGREKPSEGDEFDDEDEDAIVLRDGEQYQDDVPINGSQPSVPPTIAETSDEDMEEPASNGTDLGLHREESNVSLPESLARNHWESAAPSTTASTPRRAASGYGTSQPSTIDPSSPLAENPWLAVAHEHPGKSRYSLQRLFKPLTTLFPAQSSETLHVSAAQAAHSAPDLPITARSRSHSSSSGPRTPGRPSHLDDSGSIPPHSADGSHLANRHSIATIYPGPFTSPLSSSLSAIVADSLRRQVNFPYMRAKRTPRPRLPGVPVRGRGGSESESHVHAAALENAIRAQYNEGSPIASRLRHTRSADAHPNIISSSLPTEAAPLPQDGRRRSLSNRLGSFFRGKRIKQGSSTPSDEDGHATPSGEDQV